MKRGLRQSVDPATPSFFLELLVVQLTRMEQGRGQSVDPLCPISFLELSVLQLRGIPPCQSVDPACPASFLELLMVQLKRLKLALSQSVDPVLLSVEELAHIAGARPQEK